jgi:hypothetical protein
VWWLAELRPADFFYKPAFLRKLRHAQVQSRTLSRTHGHSAGSPSQTRAVRRGLEGRWHCAAQG